MIAAGVYSGMLRHRRFSPVSHEFAYPIFMVLLDVDRIPDLMGISRLTGYNRFNWASFHERDHLAHAGAPGASLRRRLDEDAHAHGLVLPDGHIFLLTHLRYMGYCFNPVSFYYCCDRGGTLRLVLAEVNNTFGGTHNYWLRPEAGAAPPIAEPSQPFRASAAKSLYVSPFMEAGLQYEFALTAPDDRLVAHMEVVNGSDGSGAVLFDATLSLERREWRATEIRRALVRHPIMTAKVVAGIHWQALGLWRKGMRVVPRETQNGQSTDTR